MRGIATTAWLLAACAAPPGDQARKAWLADAIVDDNRVWLGRDLGLLETKLDRMADDPFDFVRGTAGVYFRDLARPGTERSATAFLTEPDAWSVLIAGDPHPENLGTYLPVDGPGPTTAELPPPLLFEVNDIDGAAFGPYLLDVRRAQLGLAALLDAGGCHRPCRGPILDAHVRAYVDELRRIDVGEPGFAAEIVFGHTDPVVEDLMEDALERGAERALLEGRTEETATGRRFRRDRHLDERGRGILALTIEEEAQLSRLLAGYAAPEGFRVLDAARRFGTGIASLPSVRYVVAWDRGAEGPEDDELLAIREVVDPAGLPRLHPQPPALFASQADRVVATHRALWSRPDADPRLAGLSDGAMTFKVLSWSAWNDNLDHLRIAADIDDGDLDDGELIAFADHLGRQLAAMHARAPLADGRPALATVLADVGGRDEAFVAERLADAEADLARSLADHLLFREARAELGPLLGADALDDHLPARRPETP